MNGQLFPFAQMLPELQAFLVFQPHGHDLRHREALHSGRGSVLSHKLSTQLSHRAPAAVLVEGSAVPTLGPISHPQC